MTNMVIYRAVVVPVFKMAAGRTVQDTLPLPDVCACAVTNIPVSVMIAGVLFQDSFVSSSYMQYNVTEIYNIKVTDYVATRFEKASRSSNVIKFYQVGTGISHKIKLDRECFIKCSCSACFEKKSLRQFQYCLILIPGNWYFIQ